MLVTEIEALRQEQHDINGNRISYDPQLRYEFSDNDIHKDIFRLLASFVESKSVYGKQLREKMFSTLESVIIPSLSHGALPHGQPSAISSFEYAYLFIVNDAIYCLYRLYQVKLLEIWTQDFLIDIIFRIYTNVSTALRYYQMNMKMILLVPKMAWKQNLMSTRKKSISVVRTIKPWNSSSVS